MKTLKKLLIGATAILTLTACSQEEQALRIGTEGAWPPFNAVDEKGELYGFDIDIANALCEEMKRECTFVKQDWDGIIPALQANKYDAIIASMSITEKRKELVSFSEKYYNTPARFMAKMGSSFTDEDLNSGTIGVQRGTIHHDYIKGEAPNAKLKLYGKIEDAFLDLKSGRLDAVFVDSIAGSDGFLKTPAGKGFEFRGKDYKDPKYFGVGAGIAVRKGEEALAEEFSKAIKAIRDNGKYQEISNKYFGFDVY